MVILYSTHCPKCEILEKKLTAKNISYEVVADKEIMLSKGFKTVPVLEVKGETMDFSTANKWLNNQ